MYWKTATLALFFVERRSASSKASAVGGTLAIGELSCALAGRRGGVETLLMQEQVNPRFPVKYVESTIVDWPVSFEN